MPYFPDAVDEPNSCHRTQCGANAECHQSHGMVTCVCRPGMFGNPYVGCRPECVVNCDCPTKQSCVNNRCLDPCRGACGVGAQCQPVNHMPVCYCPQDHTGDPFVTCYPYRPGNSHNSSLLRLKYKNLSFPPNHLICVNWLIVLYCLWFKCCNIIKTKMICRNEIKAVFFKVL